MNLASSYDVHRYEPPQRLEQIGPRVSQLPERKDESTNEDARNKTPSTTVRTAKQVLSRRYCQAQYCPLSPFLYIQRTIVVQMSVVVRLITT